MTDLDLDSGADLHALMDRALTDLPTPTDRLHEGAVRHGRPLRRRRRVVTGLASVAVVAAVAAVVVPIVSGSDPGSGSIATEPNPQPRPQPQPRQPDAFVAHPGWWDMSVGEMRHRLDALLPEDVEISSYAKINTDHAPGESSAWSGVFTGTLRDATDVGPGSVEIMLTELPQDPATLASVRAQHLTCDLDDWTFVDLEGPVQCETSDLHGGRPFQRTVTFTDQGVTYTEVRRWTDRGEIYAAVSSSTERKWGPPASAIRAPLTLPELITVADSSSWVTE